MAQHFKLTSLDINSPRGTCGKKQTNQNVDSLTFNVCCVCLVAQSCPILCDLMDCSLPGSLVHGDSSGKNPGVVSMPSSSVSSQLRD